MSRASNWQSHSGVSLRGGKTTAPLCSATHPQLSPLAKHLIDIVILRERWDRRAARGAISDVDDVGEREGGRASLRPYRGRQSKHDSSAGGAAAERLTRLSQLPSVRPSVRRKQAVHHHHRRHPSSLENQAACHSADDRLRARARARLHRRVARERASADSLVGARSLGARARGGGVNRRKKEGE